MKESTINETMSPAVHKAAKPRRRKVKESRGDRIYYAIVYTVLILLALIVIVFPLYMTVRIAIADKMPTGLEIFSLPETWDFANFLEAMEATQFFTSFMLLRGIFQSSS